MVKLIFSIYYLSDCLARCTRLLKNDCLDTLTGQRDHPTSL